MSLTVAHLMKLKFLSLAHKAIHYLAPTLAAEIPAIPNCFLFLKRTLFYLLWEFPSFPANEVSLTLKAWLCPKGVAKT